MTFEINKLTPIRAVVIGCSILTLIAALVSFFNIESQAFRFYFQVGFSLTMFLNGVDFFVFKRQKWNGVFYFLLSGIFLFTMIYINFYKYK